MTKISILGCGWLGFPLAKAFISNGFGTKGSTTTEGKLILLKDAGIDAFLIAVSDRGITGNLSDFLTSDVLIIDIPPKLRGSEKENFVEKMQHLIVEIKKSTLKKVLFISSTAVYADDNSLISEKKIPNPDTENGRQLFASEQLLLSNQNFETTVLRFGGLIGEDRHPVKFLAGKQDLENPDGPINLIHRDDCIGIILQIIKRDLWNEIFNAVTPFHPTRKDYYSEKATAMNLQKPLFKNADSTGKTILSDKLQTLLPYEFLHQKL